MLLVNKMEMHVIHKYQAVTCSFDCILCFRSPHYACPEVIRVSWLTLVCINIFFKASLFASTQIDPLYRKSVQGRQHWKGHKERNYGFVWLSPESSCINHMRETIVCYSHNSLRAM